MTIILVLSGQIETHASDVIRTMTFKTGFGASTYTETITIPSQSLQYWESLPHPPVSTEYSDGTYSLDFSQYVDTASVSNIARSVAAVAVLGEEDVADTILSFVQNVGYVENTHAYQDALYPTETLAAGGVCSDLSILYASMMISLGFHAVFLWYPHVTDLGGSPAAHVEVGVHLSSLPQHTTYGNYTYYTVDGVNYYVAETTNTGWLVGDIPPSLKGRLSYPEIAPAPTTPFTPVTTMEQSQTAWSISYLSLPPIYSPSFQSQTYSQSDTSQSLATETSVYAESPVTPFQDSTSIMALGSIILLALLIGYKIGKRHTRTNTAS